MNRHALTQIAFLLLRLVVGLLFMQHGGQKLLGWFGGLPKDVPLEGLTLAAGILEFYGGILIMAGLGTHFVAFLLSGQMAFAFFIGHFKPDNFWPTANGGEPAVLYCFIFLFMAAFGAGDYSLDALIMKKFRGRRPAPARSGSGPFGSR